MIFIYDFIVSGLLIYERISCYNIIVVARSQTKMLKHLQIKNNIIQMDYVYIEGIRFLRRGIVYLFYVIPSEPLGGM